MGNEMNLPWRLTRVSPEGHKSYKFFSTREQAEAWKETPAAKEDVYYGYIFVIDRV